MLKLGVDINAQDKNGWTALHWAVWKDHPQVARLLVGKGADTGLRARDGKRAIDLLRNELQKDFGLLKNRGGRRD